MNVCEPPLHDTSEESVPAPPVRTVDTSCTCVAFVRREPEDEDEYIPEPVLQDLRSFLPDYSRRNPGKLVAVCVAPVLLGIFMVGIAHATGADALSSMPFGIGFSLIAAYFLTDWLSSLGR